MSVFHERLVKAIDASPVYAGNRAKLSRALGMSPNYVSTVLSTSANPNFDIAVRMAKELEVSLAFLAGTTDQSFDLSDLSKDGPMTDKALQFFDQIAGSLREAAVVRGQEPLIDDMMSNWYKYGRQLSGFNAMKDWFDLYRAPVASSDRLEVLRMGSNSLSSRTLGTSEVSALQFALDEVKDPALKSALLRSYKTAAQGEAVLSEEYLDVLAPGHAEKIRLDYLRLLLPVQRSDGSNAILSYSKPFR
ncbi:helix-turn-helix transcriptional regulator [Thalassococcus sp. S3]|uniref:helix-turn-helix domain-containing protein n=1 Tax=Thalassococcus sp. S3 TaxID=2017482 RepID=UPI00102C7EDB|nr:helix-turn-helix transcriptional regulator [Thalassococcus sp. S3]